MYLHWLNIRCCRCSFGSCCICTNLIFAIADALFQIDISATRFSLNLQMLFSLPGMYKLYLHLAFSGIWGCFLRKFFICIPRFLWPEDVSHWNYASSTYSFYALRILPIKILHLQYPKIHYRRYLSPYPLSCYLLHKLSRYITYKKIDTKIARTFYGTGDFQYSFFKTLHIFLQSQEIPFREKLW